MSDRQIVENSKILSSAAGLSVDSAASNQLVDKAVGNIKDAAQSSSPVTEEKLQAAAEASSVMCLPRN
jgi:hypothetical protein